MLAGLCLLFAASSAVAARSTPAHGSGAAVVVAARELPAGRLLIARDVALARWPAHLRPRGSHADLRAVIGRRLSSGLSAREPVTATRLLGPGLTTGLDHALLAVPVSVAGARLADLVHAGDHVELLAVPPQSGDPRSGDVQPESASAVSVTVVATRLLVLSVLRGADGSATDLVVAADRATALRITQAGIAHVLAAVGDPP